MEVARASESRLHDDDMDFICDMSQYASRGEVTRHIPALTRSTVVHSLGLRRPMLASEKLEVMGFPYYTPEGFPFITPFALSLIHI